MPISIRHLDPENLFVPVVPPTAPLTPGLGHALGVGRRRRHQELRDAEQQTTPSSSSTSMGARWWESEEYAELERAVEEAFTDPSPTGELVRPFITSAGAPAHTDAIWAGVGIVPPPTPVYGVTSPDSYGYSTDTDTDTDIGERPLARPLPSRRDLRRQRAARPSARTIAARRLGKGTVLAMTMFGVVASNAPQHLHAKLFRGQDLTDLVEAAPSVAGAEGAASLGGARRDSVEQAVRDRLQKDAAVQSVSQAGQNAGAVVVAAAKAQAAADAAAARVARERATRDAQRDPRALAKVMLADFGWSQSEFVPLEKLWMRESGWRWNAVNPSSGACGIAQALPCSKMSSAGSDYRTNPITQITWGLDYIKDRYGSPSAAWAHSQATGWY
ncbi:MAG: hypothetical protein IPJ14_08870 [Kineosporiaceae bacterium]|nr:hypothetical protein [Kineosporiaceae bacterium]